MSLLLGFFRRFKTVTLTAIATWLGQEKLPVADVTDGEWVNETGGKILYPSVDEAQANDADYIRSATSLTTAEVQLNTLTTPSTGTVSLFVRAKAQTPNIHPLTVSGNGRYLVRADGLPFNICGDAGNSMSVQLSQADVTTYLADRAAKGVNTVWFNMIEHKFSDNTPKWKNSYGDLPFTSTISGEVDFLTPNEVYWKNIDFIINRANHYGITLICQPAYLGFGQLDEGFGPAFAVNPAASLLSYGYWIGDRYKNFPNIIWSMGGDALPNSPSTYGAHINNLANGIKTRDPNHLMTSHPSPTHSSFDDYNQPWLDINAAYPADPTVTHKQCRLAWQQATKPVFMFEGDYGNEHAMTDILLRIQMYHGMLGSGVGQIYGCDPMWYFGINASSSGAVLGFPDINGDDWHNDLNAYGASYLQYAKRLQNARPLHLLTPDYSHTAITAGYDPGGVEGITYCPAMYNTQILVAYNKQGSGTGLTVNKAVFTSATFNVRWYNPRDGSISGATTTAMGSGTQVFTAPDTNDWVLLLDDQALGLGSP
jgi:hypothetical protein